VGRVEVRDVYVGEGCEHEAVVYGEWSRFFQGPGQGPFVVEVNCGAEPNTVDAGVPYFLVEVGGHKSVAEGLGWGVNEPEFSKHIDQGA
jgi:hypothetical protein